MTWIFFFCFLLLWTAVLRGVRSCPVIHINQEKGPDFYGQTHITTIVQGDQIKHIFENVTKMLLDNQEDKIRELLSIKFVNELPKQVIENAAQLLLSKVENGLQKIFSVAAARPRDCQDLESIGITRSGVYTIYLNDLLGFPVYCDMDDGAWTVIQRRIDGSVNFNKNWNSYLNGFGKPEHEYWLGNQKLHLMTSSARYQLRIDMTNDEKKTKTVTYDVFNISDAESGFKLFVDGFHGDSGIRDDLAYHNSHKFSTFDKDQDSSSLFNCADRYNGGWWYNECHYSHLNGEYGTSEPGRGIIWRSWTGTWKPLLKTEMKIQRDNEN